MKAIVEFPLMLKNPLNGSREHWAVKSKRAKAQKATTTLMLKSNLPAIRATMIPWLGQAHLATHDVRLVRLYEGRSKPMDDDGLSAAFKHVRDAVAEFFCIDDGDPRIRFTYAQAKGKAAVRIELSVEPSPRLEVDWVARGMPLEYTK